eukprot:TRINITY_DN9955_c0_g1_i4.p4 TRINITY_DN9955_c0_g1~~TRINITY_DN9955_c0_g1_i4.p4  ORF type:complete len:102 (-),score=16.93 TRINITY_DN9955_c0_g1_i4:70-375(-)
MGQTLRFQHLLNYYLIMLLDLLIECGLFTILLELCVQSDEAISKPATQYLKEMLYLIFNLLPDSEKYGSFLLAAAKLDDNMLVEQKAKVVDVVTMLSLIHI